jgi:hypothetical protein
MWASAEAIVVLTLSGRLTLVMWITPLVMAAAVSLEPFRLGMTVLMISPPRPGLQLLSYLTGSFVIGTTVGRSLRLKS